MNKRIRWIIISVLTIIVLAIGIMAIVNELNLHYKIEEISEYNYFILEQNGKYGVIDKSGNIVIDADYEAVQIPNPSKDIFICIKEYNQDTKEYATVVYNGKKEEILSNYNNVQAVAIFTNINSTPYERSVLTYKENGKYGLIDLQGKEITKPIYDEISSINYKEGTFLVKQNLHIKSRKKLNFYDIYNIFNYNKTIILGKEAFLYEYITSVQLFKP